MSICSAHQEKKKDCPLCEANPEDIFPDWKEKLRHAQEAGIEECECGFKYFKTTNICPKCSKRRLI